MNKTTIYEVIKQFMVEMAILGVKVGTNQEDIDQINNKAVDNTRIIIEIMEEFDPSEKNHSLPKGNKGETIVKP